MLTKVMSETYHQNTATIQVLDQTDTQLVFLFFQLITLEIKNEGLSHYTSKHTKYDSSAC